MQDLVTHGGGKKRHIPGFFPPQRESWGWLQTLLPSLLPQWKNKNYNVRLYALLVLILLSFHDDIFRKWSSKNFASFFLVSAINGWSTAGLCWTISFVLTTMNCLFHWPVKVRETKEQQSLQWLRTTAHTVLQEAQWWIILPACWVKDGILCMFVVWQNIWNKIDHQQIICLISWSNSNI